MLGSLLRVLPRLEDIVDKFQTEILPSVFAASKSLHIGRPGITVMALRRRNQGRFRPMSLADLGKVGNKFVESGTILSLFDTHNYDQIPTSKRQSPPLLQATKPLPLLYNIAEVAEGIEGVLQSFTQTRTLGPSRKSHRSLSPIEVLRNRRALWRFQLCYDLCHAKRPAFTDFQRTPSACPNRFVIYYTHQISIPKYPPKQGWLYTHAGGFYNPVPYAWRNVYRFMQTLCRWEIEEIDAVRFHPAAEINALLYKGIQSEHVDLLAQPLLLQQLINDLDHWHEATHNSTNHILVADPRLKNCPEKVSKYWHEACEADRANTAYRARLSARFEEQWEMWMWDFERLSETWPTS